MCCVIAALFALGPRAAILIWWLVDQVRWNPAFDTFLLPLLGFLILPWTTLMWVARLPGRRRRLRLRLARASGSRSTCSAGSAAATRTATGSGRRGTRPRGERVVRTNLTADDVADLLEAPVVAILATRRADDTTMLSPVWFEWRDGGFNVWASASDKGKVGHIERDPRVSIVVANSEWPYKGDRGPWRGPPERRGLLRRPRPNGPALLRRRGRGGASPSRSRRPGVVIRIEPGELRAWDYEDEV